MRTKGSAGELEVRRRIAGQMLQQGYGPTEVAQAIGVSLSSVKRWKRAMDEGGGLDALAAKPHPGKRPYLDPAQKEELVEILLAGPLASGYRNDLWTCPRVAEVIAKRFGVRYHVAHVWRLLDSLGWSPQKPQQRAREGNDEKIRRWRNDDWPRIKKELRKTS